MTAAWPHTPSDLAAANTGAWSSQVVWELLFAGLAVLLATAGFITEQRKTRRQQKIQHIESLLARDRESRSAAYRDFLVAQSSRVSTYLRFVDAQRRQEVVEGGDEANREVAALEKQVDLGRHLAWEALAMIRLVGGQDVIDAADAYNALLNAHDPRYSDSKPLQRGARKEIEHNFTQCARADLNPHGLMSTANSPAQESI